ncbi:MAG: DUF4426 domain-containing protein [Pseudomonadales bacterium]|jgi:hypothetical protein
MGRLLRYLPVISLLVLAPLALAPSACAEQFRRLGNWDVHYIVVRTSFLTPEIAARNGIVRGRDRAFLNISVLGPDGAPVAAEVSGTQRNLLEQVTILEFKEIREGEARYYLAQFQHTDRDTLRFAIDIVPPDGKPQRLAFQQQMFEDGR